MDFHTCWTTCSNKNWPNLSPEIRELRWYDRLFTIWYTLTFVDHVAEFDRVVSSTAMANVSRLPYAIGESKTSSPEDVVQ